MVQKIEGYMSIVIVCSTTSGSYPSPLKEVATALLPEVFIMEQKRDCSNHWPWEFQRPPAQPLNIKLTVL